MGMQGGLCQLAVVLEVTRAGCRMLASVTELQAHWNRTENAGLDSPTSFPVPHHRPTELSICSDC